jgi:hypothetical protein
MRVGDEQPSARIVPTWTVSVALGLTLVVVALAKYGIGSFPNWVVLWDVANHWQDPLSARWVGPGVDYLLGNSLGAVLSGMTGAVRTREGYGLFHTALTLVAILLPFLMPSVRSNAERARLLFVLLAAGPVVGLLMVWIGGYDPMSVIGVTLVGLSRSPRVMMLGWFVFAFNHWTMALFAMAAWIPVVWFAREELERRDRLRMVAMGIVGMLAGNAAIHIALRVWGAGERRVGGWDMGYFDEAFFHQYLSSMGLIVASLYGLGWIVLALLAWRRVPAAWVLLVVSLVACLLVQFPARDATRDTALTMLPALLVVAVAATTAGRVVFSRRWWFWAAAVVAVLAPTVVVFGWQATWLGWTT